MASKSKRRVGVYKKDFFYKDVKVLSVHIDEPFSEPACRALGIRRMEHYYRGIFASFRRYCQTSLLRQAQKSFDSSPPGEFECCFAALKLWVSLRTDSLISICCDRTEIRGANDRSFLRYADTWHLPSGRVAELKEFISHTKKKDVVRVLTEKIEARAGQALRSDYKKRARSHFSPRRFYLTDRGVVLFYQPLTLDNDPDKVFEVLW